MGSKSKGGGGSGFFSWQTMLPVGGGVLLLAGLIYWGTRPSATDLLDAASPTPDQIRQIASSLLLHEDFKVRARASEKLCALGPTAVPVLKDVAQAHQDPMVRKAVMDILIALDTKAAAEVATKLSQDNNPEVQRSAITAAKYMEDPRSYEILSRGIQSQDESTRLAAIQAVGARREQQAVSALEGALRDPSSSITVKRHAARSLQLITGKDYNSQVR
jgi:HEAT repeat protein